MKTPTLLLSAICMLAPTVLSAAGFEGKITMSMTGPRGESMPMTMSIKPGFNRIDMQAEGHSASVIMDQAKQEAIMLMPEQKMYMVHPLQPATGEQPAEQPSDVKIEKTGEHEKILGYDTTKYVITDKHGTTNVWITDQLGTFMGLGGPMGGPGGPGGRRGGRGQDQAWENAFRGKDAFPLRVSGTRNGKETFKMEVTGIEKGTLASSLFAPPADFQKFDMGAMMRGMGMPGMGGRQPKDD